MIPAGHFLDNLRARAFCDALATPLMAQSLIK